MIQVLDEKSKKEFLMKKANFEVKFTLLDMGEFVGYRSREWWDTVKPYWETMFVEVTSQDPNKCLRGEFLIDSDGSFQKLLISDKNGNARIIFSIQPLYGRKKQDYEFYYGKGIHKQGDSWFRELFVEKSSEDGLGKEYYYDQSTDKFIDSEGCEAPKTMLTNRDLGNLFISSAANISRQFRDRKDARELDDVEFGDL